jgi:hypothetical protein
MPEIVTIHTFPKVMVSLLVAVDTAAVMIDWRSSFESEGDIGETVLLIFKRRTVKGEKNKRTSSNSALFQL